MIRSLRQRHRQVFAVLTLTLPAALAIGIAARRPVPVMESRPDALTRKSAAFAVTTWARDDLFRNTGVRVVLLREREKMGAFGVRLSAPAEFIKPDLLVYWSAAPTVAGNDLPDDAILLGAFSGTVPLRIPGEHAAVGKLILYSLADGEVVDVSKPLTLQ